MPRAADMLSYRTPQQFGAGQTIDRSVPMATPTGEYIPPPTTESQTQWEGALSNPSIANILYGAGEAAMSVLTSPVPYVAGMVGYGYGALTGKDPKATGAQFEQAVTIQPQTALGQYYLEQTGDKLSALPPVVSGIPTPRLGAGAARYAGQQYALPLAEKGLTMYEQGKLTPGFTPISEMVAWHGTPHNIEGKFDITKVGTGEGAQAYGHGMYYGGARGTGETYQKNLSDFTWAVDGKPYDTNNAAHRAAIELKISGGNVNKDEIIKRYERNIADLEARGADWANSSALQKKQELEVIRTGKLPNVEEKSLGNLYKVDIPDEQIPKMLNWDEPLNRQSQSTKDSLAKLGIFVDEKAYKTHLDDLEASLTGGVVKNVKEVPNPTGENIYKKLVSKFGSPEAASQELSKLGITGVRYLDEGSRNWRMLTPDESTTNKYVVGKWPGGGPEQKYFDNLSEAQAYLDKNKTSNFVVFQPETVKILEKNDKPVDIFSILYK
jgi:hypothetical protein